jgi:hypothetical protein
MQSGNLARRTCGVLVAVTLQAESADVVNPSPHALLGAGYMQKPDLTGLADSNRKILKVVDHGEFVISRTRCADACHA